MIDLSQLVTAEDRAKKAWKLAERQKISVVQDYMDSTAKELRYDGIASAVSYAEEPSVPKFQEEGQAFRAWRSLVWAKCYEILDEVNDGKRPIPSDEELIAELPQLVLPTTNP